MPLALDAGFSSQQGKRKNNEDSCLVVTPSTGQYVDYGALLAVADGVGGMPGGLEASACAVKTLRESYYASPESWSLERALKDCFDAVNQAVLDGAPAGRATTLSALVLRNRRWMAAHVGDTRVWLLRNNQLKQLTVDHTRVHVGIGAFITRACGLDVALHTDLISGEASEHDLFLITSDGVHQTLDEGTIATLIQQQTYTAQEIAEVLTLHALQAGSEDNVSVCAARILALPAHSTVDDFAADLTTLPVLPLPGSGDVIDGFVIGERLHSGRMSTLYKAKDTESGALAALKFPNPRYTDDTLFMDYFLKEEWIGRRINSPYLVQTLALRPGRRTRLYTAMNFHPGETLAARIKRKKGLALQEGLEITRQILTGLDHLHRKGVIHCDIKPENILIDEENKVRLIDLGVSRIERMHATAKTTTPTGTPSYMAPELFAGHEPDERADVYSAAVTLYEMLTGKFPYGEIEPFSHPSFKRYTSPERYNPEVPGWLSEVLRQGCVTDPKQRYAHAADFAVALANPTRATLAQHPVPLLERIPPERWRLLFLLSLFGNVLLALILLMN